MENHLMKTFRSILAVLVVTVIATHPSFAGLPAPPPALGSPEIDPGMCMGALAFLGGAILVIRGRVRL